MKKVILLFVAVAALSCAHAQKTKFSEEALSETLLSANGAQVAFQDILKKYKGKNLVIEVWASWCSDCVKAMPKIKELQAGHPNSAYVFISMDKTADKWKEGIQKHELVGDHYMAKDGMKGTFGTAIDLDWIPRYIIVNKKGDVILYRAIETDFDRIDMILKRAEQ